MIIISIDDTHIEAKDYYWFLLPYHAAAEMNSLVEPGRSSRNRIISFPILPLAFSP
jgi:hypothetical protein